jgi:Lrp/AsnC family transcriptional regulator, leucine-responsive regulatory protein
MAAESTEYLDEYSRNLLAALQQDARLSYADLGRRVGLSPSATAERMRRLEEEGIIRGYTVDIDREALGLPVLAYIRMTCDGQRYQPFLKFVHTLSEVRECHHVTGGEAFILQVTTASIAELERTIERLLAYGIPTTSMVLSSPIVRRGYEVAGAKKSPPAKPV